MNEQQRKKSSYKETVVEEATVRRVMNLYYQGYSYSEIEQNTGIKKSRIFKIVNGLYRIKNNARCSECGGKLSEELDVCRECRVRQKYGENPKTEPPKQEEEFFIKLELRPKEYERYLVVRQRKIEQLEREARERLEEEERQRRLDYDQ